MDYCTRSDIYQFIPGIDPENKKIPADTFLDPLILYANAMINSKLSDTYIVPIVEDKSPKAFTILKFLAIDLCREKIGQRLGWTTYNPDIQQVPEWVGSTREAKRELEQMRDGRYPLIDAPRCGDNNCGPFGAGYYETSFINGRQDIPPLKPRIRFVPKV